MIADLDFETYSEADLRAVGAWRYAEDPSTEILCLAVAVDDAEPRVWLPGMPLPHELAEADEIHAWNAEFECAIWLRCAMRRYGWPELPIGKLRCSMSLALSFGLPGKLEKCGAVLGVNQQKDPIGERLIQKFCKPRRPSANNPSTRWTRENAPEDFAALVRYCQQDVRAERAIVRALPRQALPPEELATYHSTIRASERGVQIDRQRAELAVRNIALHTERMDREVLALTGHRSSQLGPIRDWLFVEHDVWMPNMQAQTIEETLEDPALPDEARRVLEIRQSVGQVSVKKFHAMLRARCRDDRVRGMVQYHGAQTGRWAGRLVQLQNLAKPTADVGSGKDLGERIARWVEDEHMFDLELLTLFGDPMAFYSAYVRPMLTASPGHELMVADFNAIECRVLAWLAGETWLLEAFEQGGDPYVTQASDVYGREITKADDAERQVGKRIVLGCGYQMGPDKFMVTSAKYGAPVTAEFAEDAVTSYRRLNRNIVQFWWDMDRAAKEAVTQPGRVVQCRRIAFKSSRDWLQMRLPSGRLLSYRRPTIGRNRFDGESIVYEGVNSLTKQWGRQETYGGRLVENATQAVARDICRDAILRLDPYYRVLFSSHDEIVSETPWVNANIDAYVRRMVEVPAWAAGCPIAAEGWTGSRYRK